MFLSSLAVQKACSTYHDAFNNGLCSYIGVIAKNPIKKHLMGRNLSFKQLSFVLRYLLQTAEPLHNCTFALSACNRERKSGNIKNFMCQTSAEMPARVEILPGHRGESSWKEIAIPIF